MLLGVIMYRFINLFCIIICSQNTQSTYRYVVYFTQTITSIEMLLADNADIIIDGCDLTTVHTFHLMEEIIMINADSLLCNIVFCVLSGHNVMSANWVGL